MADMKELVGNEQLLFGFMLDNGYPVYHRSNMFLRDLQYTVRDYYRDRHGIDVGTRTADVVAAEIISDLEQRGLLKPFARQTWVLNDERYLKAPPVKEDAPPEETATEESSEESK